MKYLILASLVFFNLISCSSSKSIPSSAQTETFKVWGNCGMCKKTIEGALQTKGIYKANWNKDTKLITVSFDSTTNIDAIQQKIASVGYDTEKYSGDDNAYKQLPQCCKYDRKPIDNNELKTQTTTTQTYQTTTVVTSPIVNNNKPAPAKTTASTPIATPSTTSTQTAISEMDMHNHTVITETKQEVVQLKAVFENYFAIKDALVQTDGKTVSAKATDLLTAMGAVKMELLATNEHLAWMKVVKDLTADAAHIAETKDTEHQRVYFSSLSTNMYTLIKTTQQETPTYLQHCPMANDGKGADWLSKESAIKNPYYGSQMLSCGKTVETINNK